MYKALTFAAGVATVAAQGSITLISPFTINDGNGKPLYSASLGLKYNAGYTTQYNPQYGANTPDASNSETYALNLFANAALTFWHEAFGSYYGQYDFIMDALDFTPYGQTVTWSRFDNGNGWKFDTWGYYNLNFGNWKTRVRENAKTCSWSALNNGGSFSPVCAYNDDKVTDYIDPVWKFNTGAYIVQQTDSFLDNIYGAHNYYTTVTTGN
jgi:hypothetical protein